jgi:hypothetical protein
MTTNSNSPTNKSQRELVLASLRRGSGKDNCAGHKHGLGTTASTPTPRH